MDWCYNEERERERARERERERECGGVLPAVLQRVKGEDAEKSNRWVLRVKREDVERCYNEWREGCYRRFYKE